MPNPVESFRYIKYYTACILLNILKTLAILSDPTVIQSAVDQEDLKPYWKSEKKVYFSKWSTSILLTNFSKTNPRKKTNRMIVFSYRPLPNILKYREQN